MQMQIASNPDRHCRFKDFWLIVYSDNSEKQPAIPLFFWCYIARAPGFTRRRRD
jgi:hypothetical protein